MIDAQPPPLHPAVMSEARPSLTVTCYGRLAESIGRSIAVQLPSGVEDVAGLKWYLAGEYPAASAELRRLTTRVAIGAEIVADTEPLNGVREVELIPALSGG
jgi:molybdopterin converting factor small subunit